LRNHKFCNFLLLRLPVRRILYLLFDLGILVGAFKQFYSPVSLHEVIVIHALHRHTLIFLVVAADSSLVFLYVLFKLLDVFVSDIGYVLERKCLGFGVRFYERTDFFDGQW
jgi:hypothetical protein